MQLCLLGSHACPPTPRIIASYHQRRLPMIPVIWSLSTLPSAPPVQIGVSVVNLISKEFVVMQCSFTYRTTPKSNVLTRAAKMLIDTQKAFLQLICEAFPFLPPPLVLQRDFTSAAPATGQ